MDQKIKLTPKEKANQIRLAADIIEHDLKWEYQDSEFVKGIGFIPTAFKKPKAGERCPLATVNLGNIIRVLPS